ncbi:hypothetical protein EIP91_009292 [Steccherinum ochraceum]|uniref:Uncharacterized protein n=1 Tax=Steccherinum ochraceum TaxID=92696 RepID=A0A4R0R9X6_9APHY|nr:hypothetical protein EIP91_009292 [Steccherinum ochraceum]
MPNLYGAFYFLQFHNFRSFIKAASTWTASILYAPNRDGDPTVGWNVTYSSGTINTGYGVAQGVGTDSHWNTHDGASLQFSWVGSAVYLFGDASPASFSMAVDGATVTSVGHGGLLGSQTGLKYGNHTMTLITHGTKQVTFQHAEVTVGIGYSSGPPTQNRTIFAVENDNTTPNSFFSYVSTPGGNTWHVEDAKFVLQADGTESPFPRQMVTASPGDSVSFTVTQTTAFFLYGAVNADHLPKTATITPSSNPSQIRRTIINDFSSALDFKQILFWESGLDRDETYTVQIAQIGPGETSLSFSSLDLLDGGPVPSVSSTIVENTSSGTQTANQSSQTTKSEGVQTGVPSGVSDAINSGSTRLGTGAIASISTVSVAVLILSMVVVLLFWRHRRHQRELLEDRFKVTSLPLATESPSMQANSTPSLQRNAFVASAFGSASPQTGSEAGPASTVSPPPAYEPRWADRQVVSTASPSPVARFPHGKRRR